MSTQSQDYKAERDELEDRCIRLASLNRELVEALDDLVYAYDSGTVSPHIQKYWNRCRALLAKAKESA